MGLVRPDMLATEKKKVSLHLHDPTYPSYRRGIAARMPLPLYVDYLGVDYLGVDYLGVDYLGEAFAYYSRTDRI